MAKFIKAVNNPQIDTEYVMVVAGRFNQPHNVIFEGNQDGAPMYSIFEEDTMKVWQPKFDNGQWVNEDGEGVKIYNKLDFSLSGHQETTQWVNSQGM